MIYNYNEIKAVHLEITDKCNASCPMCSRNKNGGEVNQHLPNAELSLEDIKLMFPIRFVQQLDRVYMCGNFGDPIVARDTLEVYRYLRQCNPKITLGMNTNGSARSEEWWEELGSIFGRYGYVVFGIDGLEDTHHLYRKDTSFDKIIDNAIAFMKGGRARWDFIVFNHNEHQIEEARIFSVQLGFEQFRIKKTGRFFSNTTLQAKGSKDVMGRNGEVLYQIAPPENPDLRNMSLEREQKIIADFGSMENYLDGTVVSCQVAESKEIYISADGYVFPCCWTAALIYSRWWEEKGTDEVTALINTSGGFNSISLHHNSIKDIVHGEFFRNIKESWRNADRLQICSRICGENFNQFKDQYK